LTNPSESVLGSSGLPAPIANSPKPAAASKMVHCFMTSSSSYFRPLTTPPLTACFLSIQHSALSIQHCAQFPRHPLHHLFPPPHFLLPEQPRRHIPRRILPVPHPPPVPAPRQHHPHRLPHRPRQVNHSRVHRDHQVQVRYQPSGIG